ncbi:MULTISPECIES: L7Ae/L30e/S12e/Gadd45 family ribosomal protein [Lacticaseibacillus]|uniref:L7Ae/L30e/S12e/Gadd45 family ribosomal protein n=2 Tax=Lacticaseibacillus TaxID=2759736 RepID=A0ABW4CM87_9LACO|nr:MULTISPECIES: ribosomal L7Ae/L30e/S12e/Gadd45 family protein [Lacticaseibacillus]
MNEQAALNLLGLAKRAGKITSGESFVLGAIRDGSAKLVFVASDASANTKKMFQDKSSFYQVPLQNGLSQLALSQAIGAARSSIAVCDVGFANKLIKLLTSQ